MRVARLEITRFRGFESFVLVPRSHVVVVGEPRAGRSDLIAALRKVLDPRSLAARPSEWDVFRPLPVAPEDAEAVPEALLTSVEVSLVDLPQETEQLLQERLELLRPDTGEVSPVAEADLALLGVRLRYCLRYEPTEEAIEHWVEYPKSGTRAPRAERELLRAFVLDRNPPLQLRAEGALRRLAQDADPDALGEALNEFAADIADATHALAERSEIRSAVKLVARHGAQYLLELDSISPAEAVGFAAEDGSLAALLRAVQPMLDLDAAGMLPLAAHGSTTTAILTAAEASAAAGAGDVIVLADDFGDQLDAASGDYLAARLRRQSGQLWLTTRQAEVPRAFEASELVRLTRRRGRGRQAFQLGENPDRKERLRRRHLFALLGPALSARTVVLLEGPHDMETYTAVARRHCDLDKDTPPLAYGTRLVPASIGGGEGGKQELPKLATLAAELGLRVRVVLDHDKPGTDGELIDSLRAIAEVIVRLPARAAIERAIVDGLEVSAMRGALDAITDEHGVDLEVSAVADADLADRCVWALKQKGGLHRAFVDALPDGVSPPLASEVLKQLRGRAPADPLITLDSP